MERNMRRGFSPRSRAKGPVAWGLGMCSPFPDSVLGVKGVVFLKDDGVFFS